MKKNIITIILIFLLLSSCSPSRRLERICRKNPDICLERIDTIIVRDTIYIKNEKIDTIINYKEVNIGDTIIKENEKIVIRIVKLPSDSIYVEGECKEDTIYIEKKIPITVTEYKPIESYNLYLFIIVILIILYLILKKNNR